MMTTKTVTGALVAAVAFAVSIAAPAEAARMTTLSRLPGDSNSWAYDNNTAGTIVGSSGSSAVKWNRAGAVTELPLPPGETNGSAYGINDAGTIVGRSGRQPVQWNIDGSVTVLPVPSGLVFVEVKDINDQGTIIGDALEESTRGRLALKWQSATATPQRLPALPGATSSSVGGINSAGIIVGSSGSHAVRWLPDGSVSALPTPVDVLSSSATAINSQGQIAGNVRTSDGKFLAARWNTDGSLTKLPLLPGGSAAGASDINDSGVVVGSSDWVRNGQPAHSPVQWAADGTVNDLGGTSGYGEHTATTINNSGEIAGQREMSWGVVATRWED